MTHPREFLFITTRPVQEIAAEPTTLDDFIAAIRAQWAPKQPEVPSAAVGLLDGISLVKDPDVPPDVVHLRPIRPPALPDTENEDSDAH